MSNQSRGRGKGPQRSRKRSVWLRRRLGRSSRPIPHPSRSFWTGISWPVVDQKVDPGCRRCGLSVTGHDGNGYPYLSNAAGVPSRLRTGYCWRTLLAVIWTALVAQEGASNANGEGPCRGSRPFCKLGHLAIQLGFANSIGPFFVTSASNCTNVTFNVKWHDSFGATWHRQDRS